MQSMLQQDAVHRNAEPLADSMDVLLPLQSTLPDTTLPAAGPPMRCQQLILIAASPWGTGPMAALCGLTPATVTQLVTCWAPGHSLHLALMTLKQGHLLPLRPLQPQGGQWLLSKLRVAGSRYQQPMPA